MLVVQEHRLAGKGWVVDLGGQESSHSLAISWALAPTLLVWRQLACPRLELPKTNCSIVEFWFFKSLNGLAMALCLFFIGEVFALVHMLSVLIFECTMREESNKSFHSLCYNIYTFCFILSISKFVSCKCLFSGSPALAPKQLTTACFPSRC